MRCVCVVETRHNLTWSPLACCTLQSSSRVSVYKNFKSARTFRPSFSAEQLFGGALIALRSNDFVCFYDWESDRLVRRIEEVPEVRARRE